LPRPATAYTTFAAAYPFIMAADFSINMSELKSFESKTTSFRRYSPAPSAISQRRRIHKR
jgi:hypothetical protein